MTSNKANLIQALVKLEEVKKRHNDALKKIEALEHAINQAIEALEFKES